jgi:hypothetical protein
VKRDSHKLSPLLVLYDRVVWFIKISGEPERGPWLLDPGFDFFYPITCSNVVVAPG